ncbi:MAG: hypothetical protein JWP15_1981 [Alphaproteobacteria bacterium]|nr:hypothetical protein [Alphaproteobacteria bacterium]
MDKVEVPLTPATDVPVLRVTLGAWWMLVVLTLFYTISFVQRIVISMLVDPIKASLHLSDVQIGLVMGPGFAIPYCIFGYVFGVAADRLPRRLVIFGGVLLWSIAAAFCGLATSFMVMMLFRVGVGAGEAALTPAAYSLLTDRFPTRRLTTAMAIYQMGAKLGSGLAFAVGGIGIAFAAALGGTQLPLVGPLEPWQIALIITSLPGIVLALLALTFAEPAREARGSESRVREPLLPFLKSERKALSLMAIGFAVISITLYSLQSWTPAFMTRQFGWTPARYGPVLGLISIVGAASMIVKGMIVDWLYARGMRDAHLRFFTWLLALTIPIGAVAYFLTNPLWFLIAYGVLQVVALQFVVFMGATLQLFVPRALRSQVTGLFLGLFTLMGLGAGPTFTAMLTDYVFHDEAKLGLSLATTTCLTIPISFICLRLALRPVRDALERVGL